MEARRMQVMSPRLGFCWTGFRNPSKDPFLQEMPKGHGRKIYPVPE
jgi:hypothetical protein